MTGFERRVQPAGDPKADNAADAGGIEHAQQTAQLARITGAANYSHSRARSDASFLRQSGDNQDRSFAGGAPARTDNHIPTPTALLFVACKFRYLASAHSGKNF